MAKEKRSAADLDAELAALEAELAALEGKPKKKAEKPAKAAKKEKAVAAEAEPEAASADAPEEKPSKKGRFGLPSFGKKKDAPVVGPAASPAPAASPVAMREEAPEIEVPDVPEPTPARVAEPAPLPPELRMSYDASAWRHEGATWVRTFPETPVPVLRRVLDEDGNVVREEHAQAREVDDVSSVKAERGLGRLLRRK